MLYFRHDISFQKFSKAEFQGVRGGITTRKPAILLCFFVSVHLLNDLDCHPHYSYSSSPSLCYSPQTSPHAFPLHLPNLTHSPSSTLPISLPPSFDTCIYVWVSIGDVNCIAYHAVNLVWKSEFERESIGSVYSAMRLQIVPEGCIFVMPLLGSGKGL